VSMTRRRHPAIERIRALRILAGANDQDLARFDRLTYEFAANAGDVLVGEGKSACGFFVVMSGRAMVSVAGVECGVLERGMFFGETALLDRGPEPATVTALTPCVLRVANRPEFNRLVKITPFVRSLLQTLATRQRFALHASVRASVRPAARPAHESRSLSSRRM
jgi:CRP-like cAMP-binding protein